jgi:hypothetical protein
VLGQQEDGTIHPAMCINERLRSGWSQLLLFSAAPTLVCAYFLLLLSFACHSDRVCVMSGTGARVLKFSMPAFAQLV